MVVLGDGPAGSALAAACRRASLDVVLVGPDEPWAATHAAFADDLETDDVRALLDRDDVTAAVLPDAAPFEVWGHRRHVIEWAYGVIDGEALRGLLRRDVAHVVGRGTPLAADPGRIRVAGEAELSARLVVDATGPSTAGARATQYAEGVVLAQRADDGEQPMFMDLRPVAGLDAEPPTFCYVVPVHDGWLHEETVLATAERVDGVVLRRRLAARLGTTVEDLDRRAVRREQVAIPMGAPIPARSPAAVRFGAAAGYVHPATGYSVAASLRAAMRVAREIEAAGRAPTMDVVRVARAVWPPTARRTRALHRYGQAVLTRLDAGELRTFFDVFFDLPVDRWRPYMQVDAAPAQVAVAMAALFARAPWSLRRRVVTSLRSRPIRVSDDQPRPGVR